MMNQRQLTNSIIMVRPHDFGFNAQTGVDNHFQHPPASVVEAANIRNQVMKEFEQMVETLDRAGLEVLILDKPANSPTLPDAIFPNNWFSTRADGSLFIYPMKTANRQAEVQVTELQQLFEDNHYLLERLFDLRKSMMVLEGTGAMVFHHPSATIFASLSERCDRDSLNYFANTYQYNAYSFSSCQMGKAVYHTNVLMSCGQNFAVLAEDILLQDAESKTALQKLQTCVEDVINITGQQMAESFCGNILQLSDQHNQAVILMSESAFNGFTGRQISVLERHGSFVICPISTIEYIGGGSVRCMVAENYLTTVAS